MRVKILVAATLAAVTCSLPLAPQAAGMSCYSVAAETTPGRADYLVERRGFELMAIAACRQLATILQSVWIGPRACW